jgi:hypothetical protein
MTEVDGRGESVEEGCILELNFVFVGSILFVFFF